MTVCASNEGTAAGPMMAASGPPARVLSTMSGRTGTVGRTPRGTEPPEVHAAAISAGSAIPAVAFERIAATLGMLPMLLTHR
jgi:hypothetical protein